MINNRDISDQKSIFLFLVISQKTKNILNVKTNNCSALNRKFAFIEVTLHNFK